jgi:hypothetical protein
MMDWFSDKTLITLEQKGYTKREIDFKQSTLKKIKRAKIQSENDVLKLAYLVGSYVGKELERDSVVSDDLQSQYVKGIIIALRNTVEEPLKTKKDSLEKGSDGWVSFHRQNTDEIPAYLQQINNIVNASKDPLLQEAIIRPLVKYDFKTNQQRLIGSKNRQSFKQRYNVSEVDGLGREIVRVYTPSVIGYTSITIGTLIILYNVFKKKG